MSQSSSGPSLALLETLQNAASANGNGFVSNTLGYGYAEVSIVETNGGTGTVTLQGSMDGVTWVNAGYQEIDATAAPVRAAAAISVTANMAKVYQLLDLYPKTRAVLSAVATAPAITVQLYKRP